MHVMFVLPVFFPIHTGGMEVYFHGVAQELQRRSIQVSVLAGEKPENAASNAKAVEKVVMDQIGVDHLQVRRVFFDSRRTGQPAPWYDVTNQDIYDLTADILRELQPDVIHGTCSYHLSASIYQAARDAGIPYVITLVDYFFLCPLASLLRPDMSLCTGRKEGLECLQCLCGETRTLRTLANFPLRLRHWMIGLGEAVPVLSELNGSLQIVNAVETRNRVFAEVLSRAAYLIAPSRFTQQMYLNTGIVPGNHVLHSPHGHETSGLVSAASKSPSSHLRFGYTGHLLPYKGVDVLIRAFRLLSDDLAATLEIYGDPGSASAYGGLLKELADGDDRIHFHGRYERGYLATALSDIDVMVMPSLCYETFGLVIAEAFATRTPVVASRLGAMAEAVQHERNGLLFEPGNVNALAHQMARLLEDPALLGRLRSGIAPVRTIQDEVDDLVGIYQTIASQADAGRKSLTRCA